MLRKISQRATGSNTMSSLNGSCGVGIATTIEGTSRAVPCTWRPTEQLGVLASSERYKTGIVSMGGSGSLGSRLRSISLRACSCI
jgi:hypothetical protein